MRPVLTALALCLAGTCVQAATLNIEVTQDGSDVVLTGSGAIDLTGLEDRGQIGIGVSDNNTRFQDFGVVDGALVDRYRTTVDPFSNLSDTAFDMVSYSDTGTGDAFYISGTRIQTSGRFTAISGGFIRVTRGYQSLDPLNFTWRVEDTTIAALDLNFGTLAVFGNNTLTLSGQPVSAVPLPASALFLLMGAAALGGIRLHRRPAA